MMQVVCGIIFLNNKIFIARRKQGKSMAGYWEFPGGKVERGENEESALRRELLEEFGMKVKIGERLGENLHQYEKFSINLIAYSCEFIGATFELTDHDEYCWVTPIEIKKYDLAPADMPLLSLINCL